MFLFWDRHTTAAAAKDKITEFFKGI